MTSPIPHAQSLPNSTPTPAGTSVGVLGVTLETERVPVYRSTKAYGHEIGLSCCFRQWRAQSHCRLLHGYALAFKFVFQSEVLDVRNWVVDFGGLKPLKAILESQFDHTVLVAEDDPHKEELMRLHDLGVARIVIVDSTGCEKTAQNVYDIAEQWLKDAGYPHVQLVSVEVSEHNGNSAIFSYETRVKVDSNPTALLNSGAIQLSHS